MSEFKVGDTVRIKSGWAADHPAFGLVGPVTEVRESGFVLVDDDHPVAPWYCAPGELELVPTPEPFKVNDRVVVVAEYLAGSQWMRQAGEVVRLGHYDIVIVAFDALRLPEGGFKPDALVKESLDAAAITPLDAALAKVRNVAGDLPGEWTTTSNMLNNFAYLVKNDRDEDALVELAAAAVARLAAL